MLRERLGLTMRDVESASAKIAEKRDNDEFFIPPSRLSDMETKGVNQASTAFIPWLPLTEKTFANYCPGLELTST